MAECKQTAQEFIQTTFCPRVAVLCSSDAEYLCTKNNLSFVQLIQPFCRLTTEAHIRDPHNASYTIRGLKICIKDMNYLPPQEGHARKLISDAVNAAGQSLDSSTQGNVISVGDYDLQISASTPWFESFRETFLQLIPPTDHDFLSHCLACMIVVSSSHADPMTLLNSLSQHQHYTQHQTPTKPPKWFCPNTLKYYVLMHDVVESDLARAEAVYQSMKTTFGNHVCHLLQVNSRSPQSLDGYRRDSTTNIPDPWAQFMGQPHLETQESADIEASMGDESGFTSSLMGDKPRSMSIEDAAEVTEENHLASPTSDIVDHPLAKLENGQTDVTFNGSASSAVNHRVSVTPVDQSKPTGHGACLTTSDHDRLRIFIHEFAVRALIPWAEKQMRQFSDQLNSRKSIHRSLFSVKKWLGGSKPSNINTHQTTTVVYSSEAPELQIRRIADLAFLFQIYEYAYQMYNTAKRDFNNDHAWLYYAGALEMCCISMFMQGSQSQSPYPPHYMESVITTYLTTCSNPHYASRAALISTECLKTRGLYMEAALTFIKLTSEQSDLRSGLLLEQAAHCYIKMRPPMVRKYAFHMILAGHRFSKAGQRRHALRSYSQALQVYRGKDWCLAEDHINFTIGRQLFNLKHLTTSAATFRHLLTPNSKQSPAQQAAFIREYLFVYAQLLAQEPGEFSVILPELPIPVVNSNNTRVCTGSVMADRQDRLADDALWLDLELRVIKQSEPSTTEATFEPTILTYTKHSNNRSSPVSYVGEKITVEIELHNPFCVTLGMSEITLLWCFTAESCLLNEDGTPHTITNEVAKTVKNKIADEIVKTEMIAEIQLQNYERKQIQLSLIPQQAGQLRITGLAYNLSIAQTDANRSSFANTLMVRGKQKLEVQGPRLNNTKEEKVGKVYGPDRRLDLLVKPTSALLQVEFLEMPTKMLCGEVRKFGIVLKNHGTCPLHKIQLTSNYTEAFTMDNENAESATNNMADHSLYRYCEKDTSTTNSSRVLVDETRFSDVIDVTGVLEAKQTRTVFMWLHGPTTAKSHDVCLLFCYEAVDHVKSQSKRHRVLRHTFHLTTQDSLSLRATARRGHQCSVDTSQLTSCLVSCEIDNITQSEDTSVLDIEILQLSAASSDWAISPLGAPNDQTKISQKETALFCLKAVKCRKSEESEEAAMIFSDIVFDQKRINTSQCPCSDFHFRSNTTRHTPPPPPPHLPNVTTETFSELSSATDINLTIIVIWKAAILEGESTQTRTIMGQHHISLTKIDSMVASLKAPKPQPELPPVKLIRDLDPVTQPRPPPEVTTRLVHYALSHVSHVTHDFLKFRLCQLPVCLMVQNCCDRSVRVLMDTSKARERLQSDASSHPFTPNYTPTDLDFSWNGQTIVERNIPPRECSKVQLIATFPKPGVFNLNRLAVFVSYKNDDQEMVLQKPVAMSVVTIQASDGVKS